MLVCFELLTLDITCRRYVNYMFLYIIAILNLKIITKDTYLLFNVMKQFVFELSKVKIKDEVSS